MFEQQTIPSAATMKLKVLLLFSYTVLCCMAIDRVSLPDTDRRYLAEMLITYDAMTDEEATQVIYELENYYTGLRDKILDCGPPAQIDKAFHWHILNTRAYAAFCKNTFGRFVHHTPHWIDSPPTNDEQVRCNDEVSLLKDHGIDVHRKDLWGTSHRCGGQRKPRIIRCVVVNQPKLPRFGFDDDDF